MFFLRVMTFNINGNDFDPNSDDAWKDWPHRADLTLSTIRRYAADVIGLQEVVGSNIEVFRGQLPGYDYELGQEYDQGQSAAHTSIFWKRARFNLVASGRFWFSRTPDVRSSDWGVPYPMGATWVRLQDRPTGEHLFVMNTHFEDGGEGEHSRVESSKLMIERLQELAPNIPVIVTGDFNCNPWSDAYRLFLANGFTDTYRAAGNADTLGANTFHGYAGERYFPLEWGGEDADLFWRVDWILTRNGQQCIQTSSSTIIRDATPPLYPSDHYPLVSEVVVM
jgi:endonuclease/exonuclease/phosphatase family metal-dependent hydrolase